jgi:DNA-binding beta-propeller fold protein YncE
MGVGKFRLAKLGLAMIIIGTLVLLIFGGSLIAGTIDDAKDLYWPAPPERARIKYLESISSPKDLKLKQSSLFKRIVKKIVGISDGDSTMVFPYGITTDSQGHIIVVDSKSHLVHVFDERGKKYFSINAPKGEKFISPIGVAVDAADNIFVSDSYTGKILVFDKAGKFVRRLGPDEGQFDRPTGIAIDKNHSRLYVVETRKGEVEVLNINGAELFKFGKRGEGHGQFNHPTQVCLSGDRLYVTDTLNARIQIFDLEGQFISTIGRLGDAVGDLDKPKGVAVDSEQHIYVVGGLNDVVTIFDSQGNFLLAFGGSGSRRGEFYLPTAIHIDGNDNIYVADTYNRRVQVFKYLREAPEAGQ